jgi:hypothetical protein
MDQKVSGEETTWKAVSPEQVNPLLAELRNDAQRSLYSKRLSERLGIPEAVVLSELKKRIAYPDREPNKNNACEDLSLPKLRKMDNVELLNLMIHHPQTIEHWGEATSGCSFLIRQS